MKFHHVGVSVGDLDRSVEWYQRVFGFETGFSFEIPPVGVRGCFVQGDGIRVELLERAGSARPAEHPDPLVSMLHQGYGHLAVVLPDLEEGFRRCVEAGATEVWDPRQSPEPGVRFAFIADPDGNLIELIQEHDS